MFRSVALALLVTVGCADHEADRLTQIKELVCACKTSACAELALTRVPHDDVHSTRRTQAIATAMMACLAKLYDAERPTTDPDAEEPDQTGSAGVTTVP